MRRQTGQVTEEQQLAEETNYLSIEGMVTADVLQDDSEYAEVSGWGVAVGVAPLEKASLGVAPSGVCSSWLLGEIEGKGLAGAEL